MKKTLFLAILALSINAFAQNNLPISNSAKNFRGKTEPSGRKTSDILSESNFGQGFNHQISNPSSLIPINDSIYGWQWDTINVGWKIYYKEINIVYDTHHNLTSALSQTWNGSAWVNQSQTIFTYDANNNRTSFIEKNWNGSNWVNINQIITPMMPTTIRQVIQNKT